MPDSQAIPIPQGLDLCGSIADQTLFVQLLNLNFDLVVKVIEEQQSISLTLPGVPSMLIPGFPGIQIPGLSPFDIGIQAERQSLETAWIGNRILRGVPYDKRRATGRYGGTQGVKVGGTDLTIPSSDPFTVTMQYVALNFQIITELVPSITTLPLFLAGAPGSLCSLPPETRQPLINQIINAINSQFKATMSNTTPVVCPPLFFPNFTTSCWFEETNLNFVAVLGPDTIDVGSVGTGAHLYELSMWQSGPGVTCPLTTQPCTTVTLGGAVIVNVAGSAQAQVEVRYSTDGGTPATLLATEFFNTPGIENRPFSYTFVIPGGTTMLAFKFSISATTLSGLDFAAISEQIAGLSLTA